MWLQTKGSPYPTDRRVRIAACRCHRTDRPMRGIFWRRTQRALDHSGNLIIIDRARPARASFIQEPFDAILQKPSTPFADRVLMNAKLVCNRLARNPSAHRRMARQRSDNDRATRRPRTCRFRYARSSVLRTKAAIGRPTTLAITRPHHIDKSEAYNVMNFSSR